MKRNVLILLVGSVLLACTSSEQDIPVKNHVQETSKVATETPRVDKNTEKKIDYIQIDLKQFRKEIHLLTPQEFILHTCLIQNYSQFGGRFYDGSPAYYSFDVTSKILEFTEKETGHFYREVLPVYSESGTKYNAIFSRCLSFSRSEKVNKFLKELNPKMCTKTHNDGCPEINYDGE